MQMKNLWSGRFSKSAGAKLQEYWNSISFDAQLAVYDIQGSIAHASMLGKCNIISPKESSEIISGLKSILNEALEGKLEYSMEDEDIHMNVERILHSRIGEVAGKLHTARSRNDQVALDMHMYVREKILTTVSLLLDFNKSLLNQAGINIDCIMPGYTHLQRAQPVLFSHHLLAYVNMFSRDIERLKDQYKRANSCPLGAGAIAGTTFSIDREYTAKLLKFDSVYQNSMDAVSDRDFTVEFLSSCALISTHLSRFCEEIVLWSSYEFGFVTLDEAFSTGSSMMPQKKNPDLAELVRGKTGRVYGNLMAFLTMLKGLPLTYNKDMQEDKEGLFDTVNTVEGALIHLKGMVDSWLISKEKMYKAAGGNYTNATDFADYLAKKGIPFREAHEITGKMVRDCLASNKELQSLSIDELKNYSAIIESDVFEALKIENIISRRRSLGGTSSESVKSQLNLLKSESERAGKWLNEKAALLDDINGLAGK
jgi:argininosuccinate lyase